MDRMARVLGLRKEKKYSSFDLAKDFMQISILEEDRKYFGFYFARRIYVFKRLPFFF